jgi:hypothetical protein
MQYLVCGERIPHKENTMIKQIKRMARNGKGTLDTGRKFVRLVVFMQDGTPLHSQDAVGEKEGHALYRLFSKMENVDTVFLTVDYWSGGYCLTSETVNFKSLGGVKRYTSLYHDKSPRMIMYQGNRPPVARA